MNHSLVLNLPISLKLRLNLALKLFWTLAFILIISLLIVYIFQVNSLASESYFLKIQEKKLVEMKKEKEILEINFAKANSLGNIEVSFQNQNFEKANQVKYIRILETSVARLPQAEGKLLKE